MSEITCEYVTPDRFFLSFSEPQKYKSYISPIEFKNDKDVEVKDEPMETTEEFLITEECPDYVQATDGNAMGHVDDSHAPMAQNKESEMEMTYYECEVCKAKFESDLQAKRHEQVHELDKPFHCQSCKITFRKRGELNKHMNAHDQASRYRCKECSWRFVSRSEKDREKALRNQEIQSCLYCGNKLSSIEINNFREKQVHKNLKTSRAKNNELAILEETGECRLCKVTFTLEFQAKRHATTHSFDRPFQCYECESSYEGKYGLQKHLDTHKVVSQYRCKECCLQFTDSNERDHRRAFRNYRIKSCFYCGEKLSGIESNKNSCSAKPQPSSTVKNQVDNNNSGEIEAVTGNQEGYVGDSLEVPAVHNKEMGKILQANECGICNVTFKSSFEAKRHEKMHSLNAPFKCHECDKSYQYRHYLQRHMDLHKLASQYNCKECSLQFTNGIDHDHDTARSSYHRIRLCFYCGSNLPRFEGNINSSGSSSSNSGEVEAFPSVDQHLSKLIQVRSLPANVKDGGKGRTEYSTHSSTDSNTVHQLSSYELKDLQMTQQRPTETKTGEFLMDVDNCDNIEGEPQGHSTENLGESNARNETRAEAYQCDICCLMLNSSFVAKAHRRIHTFVKPFQCHECECNFHKRESLRNHMKIHKRVSHYRCRECSQDFTNGNEEDREIALRNYRVATCLYCGKKFSRTESNMDISQASKTGDFQIYDSRSGDNEVFERAQQGQVNVSLEASRVQNAERVKTDDSYRCEICYLILRSRFDIERHKRIHTIARPFRCQDCNVTFGKILYLRNHMKIHQLVSQYRCKKCEFPFTSQDKREYENDFQKYPITSCLYCGNELPGIEANMHDSNEERVSDSLPALTDKNEGGAKLGGTDECKICEIKFRSNIEAKRHENVHSFETPFQCHICDISYQRKSSLQKHMKHHKTVSEYKCKECSFLHINRSDKELRNALGYQTKSCLYCGEKLPGLYIVDPVEERQDRPLIIAKQKILNSCWYLLDVNTNCKLTLYDLEKLHELREESLKTTTKGFLINGEHSTSVDALEECKRIIGKDEGAFVDDALQDGQKETVAEKIGSFEEKSNEKVEGEDKETMTDEFRTSGEHSAGTKVFETNGNIMEEDQDGYGNNALEGVQNENAYGNNSRVEANSGQKVEGKGKEATTEEFLTSGKQADRVTAVEECGLMQENQQGYVDDALRGKGVQNEKAGENSGGVEAKNQKLEGESKETTTEELLINEKSEGNESVDFEVLDRTQEISDDDDDLQALNREKEKVAEVKKIHEREICKEKFRWESEAEMHKISHANETPVYCNICNIKFKAMVYLEDHLIAHKEVSRYRCKYCSKGFPSLNDKDCAKYLRHNWLITSCFYCQKELPSTEGEEEQFKPVGMIDEVKSDEDGDVVININTSTQHPLNKRKTDGINSFSNTLNVAPTESSKNYGVDTVLASILNHPFKTLLLVKTAPKSSGDGKETDCNDAGKLILTKSIHQISPRTLEDFLIKKRPSCVVEPLGEDMNKEPVISSTQPTKRPYTEGSHECEICRKRFKGELEAKVHSLHHGKERTFDCRACKVTFPSLDDLQKHVMDHEEASRKRCRDCRWRFTGRRQDSSASKDADRASRISRITSCFYCAKEFPVKQGRRKIRTMPRSLESSTSRTDGNTGPVIQARNSDLVQLNKWQDSKMLKDMLRVLKDHDNDVREKNHQPTADDKKEPESQSAIVHPCVLPTDDKKEPEAQSKIMGRYPSILPKPQMPVPRVPVGQFLVPMQNIFLPRVYMPPVNFRLVQGFPQVQAFPQVRSFNCTSSTQQVPNNPAPQSPKAVEKPCSCKTCGKLFQNKREVVTHQKEHHACRECGKQFRLKCQLDNSELGHGLAPRVPDKTTYICEQCGLSSTDFEKIREHTLLHVEK